MQSGAIPVPDRPCGRVRPNGAPVNVAAGPYLPELPGERDHRRGVCACSSRRAPNTSSGAAALRMPSPRSPSPRSPSPRMSRGRGGRHGERARARAVPAPGRTAPFPRPQHRTDRARRARGRRPATVTGRRQRAHDPALGGGDRGHQPDLRVRRGCARLRPRGARRPARHVAGLDHARPAGHPGGGGGEGGGAGPGGRGTGGRRRARSLRDHVSPAGRGGVDRGPRYQLHAALRALADARRPPSGAHVHRVDLGPHADPSRTGPLRLHAGRVHRRSRRGRARSPLAF